MDKHTVLRRFPRLQAAYQGYRECKYRLRPPRETPQGFWLAGSASMQTGQFEPLETALVESTLPAVDVLINVGANVGYYCCLALSAGKQVIAFEPMPSNLQLLMRNISANGWQDSIEIFPMALSSRIGIIDIYGGGTGASLLKGWAGQSEEDVTRVPVSTLDLTLGRRFEGQRCLILIDVEGAELDVLQGARRLLQATPRPIWLVEIAVSEHQPAGISVNPNLLKTFELFQEYGYSAYTVDAAPRMVRVSEVQEVVASGRDSLRTHNFLFR